MNIDTDTTHPFSKTPLMFGVNHEWDPKIPHHFEYLQEFCAAGASVFWMSGTFDPQDSAALSSWESITDLLGGGVMAVSLELERREDGVTHISQPFQWNTPWVVLPVAQLPHHRHIQQDEKTTQIFQQWARGLGRIPVYWLQDHTHLNFLTTIEMMTGRNEPKTLAVWDATCWPDGDSATTARARMGDVWRNIPSTVSWIVRVPLTHPGMSVAQYAIRNGGHVFVCSTPREIPMSDFWEGIFDFARGCGRFPLEPHRLQKGIPPC